ncbi:MAG TPA: TlpA disulfide reductase family protein [Bacteroidales bacterium]|nr:TlpA disulfide reductase family protein [Bacteroidales bacterium]
MKKLSYFLITALIAWSCSSKDGYTIKGKIEGADNITFYLQKREAGKAVIIDSAVSKKGSFTMKGGEIEYPQIVQIIAGDTKKRTSFYLENSNITIKGTLDSIQVAKVTGSKTNDEYQQFLDSYTKLADKVVALYSEYQAAGRSGDKEKIAGIEKQAEEIENEMINLQKEFINNNPSSYVTPSFLASLADSMEPSETEEMISKLDTALLKTQEMIAVQEMLKAQKTVAIGQKAPDFTLNDVNGNPISLSSKIGSKLLLVDFWAGWCGPCRQENPNVVKVYNEFNKKGFDIFGVSLDQTKESWTKAIADDKLTWTHVSDLKYWGSEAAALYNVRAIPANFLLDETGTIIAKNLRGEELQNKVKEILGN